MNYINFLQEQLRHQHDQLASIRESVLNLERYLLSEKFKTDSTVQVGDILLRLEPIKIESI